MTRLATGAEHHAGPSAQALEIRRLRAALAQAEARLESLRGDEQRARRLALHDELTALPNRRHLLQCLEQALREPRRSGLTLALLFVDLDGFKAINDRHGHATGDEVLRIVAARLRGAVRSQDTVVRFGGDEFVCLVHRPASHATLRRLSNTLIETVSGPMRLETLTAPLTIRPSIGVALSPRDGTTADELIAHADQAMYRAKRERTGCTFFFDFGAAAS